MLSSVISFVSRVVFMLSRLVEYDVLQTNLFGLRSLSLNWVEYKILSSPVDGVVPFLLDQRNNSKKLKLHIVKNKFFA